MNEHLLRKTHDMRTPIKFQQNEHTPAEVGSLATRRFCTENDNRKGRFIGGSKGAIGTLAPSGSRISDFHAIFRENWCPIPWEILDPPCRTYEVCMSDDERRRVSGTAQCTVKVMVIRPSEM